MQVESVYLDFVLISHESNTIRVLLTLTKSLILSYLAFHRQIRGSLQNFINEYYLGMGFLVFAANMLDLNIVVSNFELQSRYYVHI